MQQKHFQAIVLSHLQTSVMTYANIRNARLSKNIEPPIWRLEQNALR